MENAAKGKIIVISAPSGTGKSTVIGRLMKVPGLNLGFSISATSRSPRAGEADGREYWFITDEEFRRRIEAGDFVEHEEVYAGTHYGTLKSEVERVCDSGRNLIMDIDVKGALSVKKLYGDRALSIFLVPPSLEVLEKRLRGRASDSEETIRARLGKAEYEIGFAPEFDVRVVNDSLDRAVEEMAGAIRGFIARR